MVWWIMDKPKGKRGCFYFKWTEQELLWPRLNGQLVFLILGRGNHNFIKPKGHGVGLQPRQGFWFIGWFTNSFASASRNSKHWSSFKNLYTTGCGSSLGFYWEEAPMLLTMWLSVQSLDNLRLEKLASFWVWLLRHLTMCVNSLTYKILLSVKPWTAYLLQNNCCPTNHVLQN